MSRTDIIFISKILTMLALWNKLVILFTCFYFAIYRAEIRAFFFHWSRIEEQYTLKGVDAGKIKRAGILVSVLYYTYNILFWLYTSCLNVFGDGGVKEDLLANYYPHLVQNESYLIWLRFQTIFSDFLFLIFCPLVDKVPALVYYHSAKIVEGFKFEVLCELAHEGSKSGIIYNLWSRFEALKVMVQRADRIFGPLVILCQGFLFFNICGFVYIYLEMAMKNMIQGLPIYFWFYLISPLLRLLFTVCFTIQLECSSSELSSTVALYFNKRLHCFDDEERQMTLYFLNRLNQIKLAACPSGFYRIKPSIFLTMLSLILTYTILLLQTNDNPTQISTLQNNNCTCI